MLDLHAIKVQDISALNPSEWAFFAGQLLAQINEQSKHIAEQTKRINADAQAIKWRDAKIESITFQLTRLKAWGTTVPGLAFQHFTEAALISLPTTRHWYMLLGRQGGPEKRWH